LSLRQSGTLFSSVCGFPRSARKTAHKKIGKYRAAAGNNVAL